MSTERVLWKGLLAGLAGGLAATAAEAIAEKLYEARGHSTPEAVEGPLHRLTLLAHRRSELPTEVLRWGFGAAAGAAYGALAEFYPAASAREGAAFGTALLALTREASALESGAEAVPSGVTANVEALAPHLLFGLITEKVRSAVRHSLDSID